MFVQCAEELIGTQRPGDENCAADYSSAGFWSRSFRWTISRIGLFVYGFNEMIIRKDVKTKGYVPKKDNWWIGPFLKLLLRFGTLCGKVSVNLCASVCVNNERIIECRRFSHMVHYCYLMYQRALCSSSSPDCTLNGMDPYTSNLQIETDSTPCHTL